MEVASWVQVILPHRLTATLPRWLARGEVLTSMLPAIPLSLALLVVFALGGVVVLVLLSLLTQRAIVSLITNRAQRRQTALAPRVYQVLSPGASRAPVDDLLALGRFDRAVLRRLLLGLALDLRGEAAAALCGLYRDIGLLRGDIARLRSWRAADRAAAAADLGVIRDPAALPALLEGLRDRDSLVRQTAVWAVGEVGDRASLRKLVPLLGDSGARVARCAEEVLAFRGREVEETVLAYARDTTSQGGRRAAIDLLGWLRVSAAADFLLSSFEDPDAEIRVKSVKAAAAIGDPRFLEPFHDRLADDRWEVRCQAAKGLSVLGSPASVPWLETALRDSQWWVRFYAAAALAEIGERGEAALAAALEDPEPRVSGMARYLLERGAAVPALP